MLIYGDPKTSATIREALSSLKGLNGRDLLIAEGMLEQGLADVGLETDGNRLPELPLDRRIELKTPEGFAFYQLYPEQYRRAARNWLSAAPRSGPIVVIGLRSIGTTLSRVVWDELQSAGLKARRGTVRPAGDPFRRTVQLPSWVDRQAEAYLIVDEGPGLSGSSFAAVAQGLESRGIQRERIHFFPSHPNLPGAAASEEIHRIWLEVSRWVAHPELPLLPGDCEWKFIGPTLPWPFDCSGEAERCARRSAQLSCGIPVEESRDWWLGFKKFAYTPTSVAPEILAKHILAVADDPLRPEDEAATEARLREMIAVNVSKHFRDSPLGSNLEGWLQTVSTTHGQKSSGDGHLAPTSWVRDANGKLWKLNTTGSKLSHFIPYRLPLLWDIAQVSIEWDLSPQDEAVFLEEFEKRNICFAKEELSFFKLAVAAFELGKSMMLSRGDALKYETSILKTAASVFSWGAAPFCRH